MTQTSIAQARFILSICHKCCGCNRLEDMRFDGVKQCNNFRKAKGMEVEEWRKCNIGLQKN